MKNNKTQPGQNSVDNKFRDTTSHLLQVANADSSYKENDTISSARTEDHATLVKRYSFDDNGGGYMGL